MNVAPPASVRSPALRTVPSPGATTPLPKTLTAPAMVVSVPASVGLLTIAPAAPTTTRPVPVAEVTGSAGAAAMSVPFRMNVPPL
jgi:hypothetical protein